MPVRFDERVLVNILRILLISKHMQRQPKHRLVIPPHQCIEGSPLPLLGFSDKLVVFGSLLSPRVELLLRELAAIPGSGLGRCLCHRWQ